jgi:hypothetical protein
MLFRIANIPTVVKATKGNYLKPGQIHMSTNPLRFNSPANYDHPSFIESSKWQEGVWQKEKDNSYAEAVTKMTTTQAHLKIAN